MDYIIVLNKDDDTVSFIDEAKRKVVKVVGVDKNPHEVAVTADGKKAFVSNAGGDTISVFDMTTLDIMDRKKMRYLVAFDLFSIRMRK